MRGVDPAPRQVRQSSEVVGLRQHPGLEPAHGTGRGRTMLQRATTNNPVHHRIATQSVGVVDVLVAGEAVPSIPPCARVADQTRGHVRQTKGVFEFAVKQQSTVRTDRRTTKGQLDRPIEM